MFLLQESEGRLNLVHHHEFGLSLSESAMAVPAGSIRISNAQVKKLNALCAMKAETCK